MSLTRTSENRLRVARKKKYIFSAARTGETSESEKHERTKTLRHE